MDNKLEKMKEELKRLQTKQREVYKEYSEQIKTLQGKIKKEEQRMILLENQKIADAVRSIFGEEISDFYALEEKLRELKTFPETANGKEGLE